jgi:PST family polysaccharide transporter
MKRFLDNIMENAAYKRIMSNILSLFSLQGLNYILPLVTFPYLTRVLGPDKYGAIAFATAFISYFQVLTDYGFNFSATREISINRENKVHVSKTFSSVLTTKFLLMILSFVLMSVIVFGFSKFRSDWLLYFFTFGLVIGNLLLPTWFFQGMEKMKYISLLNMGTLLIYTALIFIFIRHPSDYLYVPLINSIGAITIGIIALNLVHRDFNVKFAVPSLKDIKYQMKEGWHIFVSTVAISFYTTSNTFILGFFASNTIVGYYSVAEKIVLMVVGLLNPVSQSIYPYVSSLATKSKEAAVNFIKKLTLIIGSSTFIVSVLLFLVAGPVLTLLAGDQFSHSIQLLQILSFLPFIIGLSNVFGVLFLFAFGYSQWVSKVQFIIGLGYPILIIPMAYYLSDVGTALSLLIVETIITLSFWKLYKKANQEMMNTC